MIDDCGVRPEGCICEPCLDISPNLMDMRSEFGYITLAEIAYKIITHLITISSKAVGRESITIWIGGFQNV